MDGLSGLLYWEQIRAQMDTPVNTQARRGERYTPRREANGGTPGPENSEERIMKLEWEMRELQRRVAELDSLRDIFKDQLHVSVTLLQQKSEENQRLGMELDQMRARLEAMEAESKKDISEQSSDVTDDSFTRLKTAVSAKHTAVEKAMAVLRYQFREEMKKVQFEDKDVDPIPEVVMEFCFQIEQAVGTKVKDFARRLDLDPEEVEKLAESANLGLKDQFWKVIALWRSRQSKSPLADLVTACQKCDVSVGTGSGPMRGEDTAFLESQLGVLLEQVSLEALLVELLQCQGFSRCAHLYVQGAPSAAKEPRPEQVMRLLDVLPMMGNKALQNLFDCLDKSDQSHARQLLETAYTRHLDDGYLSMSVSTTVSKPMDVPAPPSSRDLEKSERRATY